MNRDQRAYATSRVTTLLNTFRRETQKKHTKPAKPLSPMDRATLVRSGKVKLRADVMEIHGYTDVTDVFDFSKYGWPETIDTVAVDKVMAPIEAEAQRILDQLNLGDASAALAAIEAFAKKVSK